MLSTLLSFVPGVGTLLSNWKIIVAVAAVAIAALFFYQYKQSVEEATAQRLLYEQSQQEVEKLKNDIKKVTALHELEINKKKEADKIISDLKKKNNNLLSELSKKKDGELAEVLIDTMKEIKARREKK